MRTNTLVVLIAIATLGVSSAAMARGSGGGGGGKGWPGGGHFGHNQFDHRFLRNRFCLMAEDGTGVGDPMTTLGTATPLLSLSRKQPPR
jgi:hypothetical protein